MWANDPTATIGPPWWRRTVKVVRTDSTAAYWSVIPVVSSPVTETTLGPRSAARNASGTSSSPYSSAALEPSPAGDAWEELAAVPARLWPALSPHPATPTATSRTHPATAQRLMVVKDTVLSQGRVGAGKLGADGVEIAQAPLMACTSELDHVAAGRVPGQAIERVDDASLARRGQAPPG